MLKKELTISNVLTLLRLMASPVVMLLIINYNIVYAFVLFVLAALTDLLDGYLARKFKQKTRFGTILDPIADKLLVGLAFTGLLIKYNLDAWIYAVLVIALIYILTYVFFVKKKLKPSLIGKTSAFLQGVAVIVFMFNQVYAIYFIILALIVSVIVVISYINEMVKK